MSYIHYCRVKMRGPMPIAGSAISGTAATIASSGTSQQSNALSLSSEGETDPKKIAWQITNGGDTVSASSVPVYLVFGSDPTAVVGGAAMRKLLMVGEVFECHCEADGEKFAVINADITT